MESRVAIHNTVSKFTVLLKEHGFKIGMTDCHAFVVYYLSFFTGVSWLQKYGLELFNEDNFEVLKANKLTSLKIRSLIKSNTPLELISNPFLAQTGSVLLGPKRATGIYDGKGILTIAENGAIIRLPMERTYEMYKIT